VEVISSKIPLCIISKCRFFPIKDSFVTLFLPLEITTVTEALLEADPTFRIRSDISRAVVLGLDE